MATVFLLRGPESFAPFWRPSGVAQLAVMAGICLLSLHYFDLYDTRNFGSVRELLPRLLQVLGTASLALGIIYYLFRGLIVVREIYLLASPLLLFLLCGMRIPFAYLN